MVDNASSDDTLDVVQRHALADPRVQFIANPDNPGFATACNQGARDSQAPWLVFINPDLMVEHDTLRRLCERAGGHAAVLLGVEQVDEHGQPDAAVRRRDPDFAAMLRAPRAAAQLAVPADPALALQPVDAISGALMLMQRSLFDRLDGWDGGYRLHAEDLDLCRRARQAGALVAVANDLQVVHVRGVSSRSRPFLWNGTSTAVCGGIFASSSPRNAGCWCGLGSGQRSGPMRRRRCPGCYANASSSR